MGRPRSTRPGTNRHHKHHNHTMRVATTTGALALLLAHTAQAFLLPFQGPVSSSSLIHPTAAASKATVPAAVGVARQWASTLAAASATGRRAGGSRVVMMSTKGAGNNQMSPESYTEKAWDVITRLPQLATRHESQFIDTEMLLKSLLEEGPAALANRIFFKAGLRVSQLETELESYIASQPKVPDASNKVGAPGGWVGGWMCGADSACDAWLWPGMPVPGRPDVTRAPPLFRLEPQHAFPH